MPAPVVPRLAPVRVAVPFASVVAEPAAPFGSVNATVSPTTGVASEVATRVAVRLALPAYVPDADPTVSVVGAAAAVPTTLNDLVARMVNPLAHVEFLHARTVQVPAVASTWLS
jgi:hypothetical protein